MKRLNHILRLFLLLLWAGGAVGLNAQTFDPDSPPEPSEPVTPETIYYGYVSLSCDPEGSAWFSGGGQYQVGTSAYLYAYSMDSKYQFQYWTDEKQNIISYSSSFYCNINSTDTLFFVAHYKFYPGSPEEPSSLNKSYVYLASEPEDACTFNYTSGQRYQEGSRLSLYAYLNKSGYVFDGWYDANDSLLTTGRSYYYTLGENDVLLKVKAHYDPNSPSEPSGNQEDIDEVAQYKATFMVDTLVVGQTLNSVGKPIRLIRNPIRAGYTFNGWGTIPDQMPGNNIIIRGSFSPNLYDLTFLDYDSTLISRTQVYCDDPVSVPADPSRVGYTFTGWDGQVPTEMTPHDLTFVAQYNINSYYLSWMVKADSLTATPYTLLAVDTVEYNAPLVPRTVEPKEGYSFSGWTMPDVMPANDTIATGQYVVNSYVVSYVADTVVVRQDTLAFGSTLSDFPDAPEKVGHSFVAWKDVPETVPAHNIVINAQYQPNSYSVIWVIDGVVIESSAVFGTAIQLPDVSLEKEGYTFVGWSKPIPATMPAEELIFTAVYEINYYKLTLLVNDKQWGDTLSLAYETKIDYPQVDSLGHTFSGWLDAPSSMPAHNLTVRGTLTPNKYKLSYLLDGDLYATDSVVYNTKPIDKTVPEKEGYHFSGWNMPSLMPAADTIAVGSYVINKYLVTFMADETIVRSDTLEYGATITTPQAPAKEGYTFVEWANVPANVPAHDVTIYANYSINSYTISWSINDSIYQVDTITYNSPIEAPVFSREGYTLSSWNEEVPARMPARNLAFSASWNINYYKLSFVIDKVPYGDTLTLAYGSVIEYPIVQREGETFSGWVNAPATMPARDLTVYGTFSTNRYKLTYLLDGEVFAVDSVLYNAAPEDKAVPAKEGYHFSGWNMPQTMPAADTTAVGSYIKNKYVIAYSVQDSIFHRDTLEFGTSIVLPEAPAIEGHTFVEWQNAAATVPAHDLTITALYRINGYKVTWMVDSVAFQTDSVLYSAIIPVPQNNPTKEGHTFKGWTETIPASMPASDLVFHAAWEVNYYNLSFEIDGYPYGETVRVAYGSTITYPTPTQEGYTFSGWVDAPVTMPANDLVVCGHFQINRYKLIYLLDGEVFAVDSVLYNTIPENKVVPAKEGHTFSGWNMPSLMPAADTTAVGSYIANKYVVSFMADGNVFQSDTLAFGSTIVYPQAPAKSGYTFSKWDNALEKVPAYDVIITAVYNLNTYKVTWMVDETVYATDSVCYGYIIVAPAINPAKEGYTFDKWAESIPATMPANDLTFHAEFAINSYTLYYMSEDVVFAQQKYDYNAPVTAPVEVPAKLGYEFVQWTDLPEVMPANDVTVNASFRICSYNLSYYVDGVLYHTDTYEYQAPVVAIEEPTKTGYTFSGWKDVPETMPASNVEVFGNFTVNCHKLTFVLDSLIYLGYPKVAYGALLVPPTVQTGEYVTFLGWENLPETMPDSDLVVIGKMEYQQPPVTESTMSTTSETLDEVTVNFEKPVLEVGVHAWAGIYLKYDYEELGQEATPLAVSVDPALWVFDASSITITFNWNTSEANSRHYLMSRYYSDDEKVIVLERESVVFEDGSTNTNMVEDVSTAVENGTAIEQIQEPNGPASGVMFDIYGRRVDGSNPHGLMIRNGHIELR